ncbi:MAG: molecular chaperone TorD family protein [Gemmataceae bacterium]
MTMTTESVADVRAVRQAVYHFLRAALGPPSPEQHAWMRSADFARALGDIAAAFGVDFPAGELVPEEWADHESRYLACFEVGLPGPPVPLLASHYQKREPAPRVIHEHILFYRGFGLPGPDREQSPADHLVYQLDFLIHIDALLAKDRVDAESALWARQDFLSRHVQRWTDEASRQAEGKGLPGVYRTLLAVLAAAVAEDREQTAASRHEAEGSP